MTRRSGGHKLRPTGTRSTRARAIVRWVPYDAMAAELDVTHFPAVFHRPKTGKAPRIQPIYRATATHWQRDHETSWDNAREYLRGLGLAFGFDAGGRAHTSYAPAEWQQVSEEERAAALATAYDGDLADEQARRFVAARRETGAGFMGDRDGEDP